MLSDDSNTVAWKLETTAWTAATMALASPSSGTLTVKHYIHTGQSDSWIIQIFLRLPDSKVFFRSNLPLKGYNAFDVA